MLKKTSCFIAQSPFLFNHADKGGNKTMFCDVLIINV